MPFVKRLCYNKNMKSFRGGFTLIELSLSLVFIGILSVTVVLLIQNTSASYRRGLILNQVNTVGMDLVDDFRISIQNATSDPVTRMCEIYYELGSSNRQACIADNANSFVSATKMGEVIVDGQSLGTMPVSGVFCTGTYSYVWNSGYFESTDLSNRSVVGASPAVVGTKPSSTGTFTEKYNNIRLLKVYDDERSICVNAMKAQDVSGGGNRYIKSTDYQNSRVPNQFVISEAMSDENGDDAVEMMRKEESVDLVLYDLYVAKPALSSTRKNLFYAASFILGTRRGGINIKEAGNNCKPPSDDYSDLEYCAINKFNFAVQAGGA